MIIYKLSSPSSKSYIGQTKRGIDLRWHEHITAWKRWIKRNRPRKSYITKLYYAFDKYDPSLWTISVIFESNIESEIDSKEDEFILEYNSINNGYNTQRGGQGWHGGTISEEHCNNISNGRKLYWDTLEGQARKLELSRKFKENNPSEKLKGKVAWNRGKIGFLKHSDETKAFISATHKGIPKSSEHIQKIHQTKIKQWADPEIRKILESKMNRIGMTGKTQSDLQKQRASEANSDTWLVTHPDGKQETITNLNKFCKEHNLRSSNFATWGHTKGYTATKINSV